MTRQLTGNALTQELYRKAAARVDMFAELARYRDVILYDWPEGDEHWRWVATAPLEEIVRWAEAVDHDHD